MRVSYIYLRFVLINDHKGVFIFIAIRRHDRMLINNRSNFCGRSYFRLFVFCCNNRGWSDDRRCYMCHCNGFPESKLNPTRCDNCTVFLVYVNCKFNKSFEFNDGAGPDFSRRKIYLVDGDFNSLFGWCTFHSPLHIACFVQTITPRHHMEAIVDRYYHRGYSTKYGLHGMININKTYFLT